MRDPIAFVYGNCVFARGLDDGWAAFAVEVSSYRWLNEGDKRAHFLGLIGALEAIEADLQILRVARRWHLRGYVDELSRDRGPAASSTRVRARRRYLEEQARAPGRRRRSNAGRIPVRQPSRAGARCGLLRLESRGAASPRVVAGAGANPHHARPEGAEDLGAGARPSAGRPGALASGRPAPGTSCTGG